MHLCLPDASQRGWQGRYTASARHKEKQHSFGRFSGAASSGCGARRRRCADSSLRRRAYLGGGAVARAAARWSCCRRRCAAKQQVSTTEASKKEAIAKFKMETSNFEAADAAEEFMRACSSERIAELDMQLTAAQHQVEEHERSRGLVQEAYQLQQQRAQASARARKSSDALRLARIKYDEALADEQSAAKQLAEVQGKLRATSPELVRFATKDGPETRELMERLKTSGAKAQSGILDPEQGDAAGAPAPSGSQSTWDRLSHGGADSRDAATFWELLRSPFERSLRGPSGRVYSGTSLGLLIWMPPRRYAIMMAESKTFDNIILSIILLNCSTMAWESPLDPCCTDKADIIDQLEWFYLGVFV